MLTKVVTVGHIKEITDKCTVVTKGLREHYLPTKLIIKKERINLQWEITIPLWLAKKHYL